MKATGIVRRMDDLGRIHIPKELRKQVFNIDRWSSVGVPFEFFIDEDNGWTVYTDDDMPSAQWEIMVLVTEDGHEVLCW